MSSLHIPFDPDFDERPESATRRVGGLSPQLAFAAGLVATVLVVGTIGFVALSMLLLRSLSRI